MNDERKQRNSLYQSDRWRRERKAFLSQKPVCVRCGKPATVVDHAAGHGGDWAARFWDRTLWQPLCWPCHSRKTVTEDDAANRRGLNGWRLALANEVAGGFSGNQELQGQARSRAFNAPRATGKPLDPRAAAAINLLQKLKGKDHA